MKILKLVVLGLVIAGVTAFHSCAGNRPIQKGQPATESTPGRTYNSRALEFFTSGENYSLEGNYPMAILEYQDALRYDTTSATIYLSLAKAYLNIGKMERGLEALKKAYRIDPDDKEIRELLGQIAFLSGDLETALKIFEQNVKSEPNKIENLYQLAFCYQMKNMPQKAIATFESIYSKDTTQVEALERALEIALMTRNAQKGLQLVKTLVSINPENTRYLRVFGDLLAIDEQIPKAIEVYKKLIMLEPDNIEIRENLGELYSYVDSFSVEPESYLKLFIESYPQKESGYQNLARYYLRNKKYTEVVALLDSVLDDFSNSFMLVYLRGWALYYLKRYQEAELDLIRALELDPKNNQVKHLLANVYESLKKYKSCDSLYEELIKSNKDDIVALNNYAYTLAVRGIRLKEALQMVEKALAKDPENPSYLDTKGWILFRMGKVKQAQKYVELAAKKESDNSEILEHLGDIYMALGKVAEAKKQYLQALKFDPENERLKNKIRK